jgi:hypothetical protein
MQSTIQIKNFFQFCTAFLLLFNEKNDRDVLANFEIHLNNHLIFRMQFTTDLVKTSPSGSLLCYHIAGNGNTCKGGRRELPGGVQRHDLAQRIGRIKMLALKIHGHSISVKQIPIFSSKAWRMQNLMPSKQQMLQRRRPWVHS